jgi:hypothetical protein
MNMISASAGPSPGTDFLRDSCKAQFVQTDISRAKLVKGLFGRHSSPSGQVIRATSKWHPHYYLCNIPLRRPSSTKPKLRYIFCATSLLSRTSKNDFMAPSSLQRISACNRILPIPFRENRDASQSWQHAIHPRSTTRPASQPLVHPDPPPNSAR